MTRLTGYFSTPPSYGSYGVGNGWGNNNGSNTGSGKSGNEGDDGFGPSVLSGTARDVDVRCDDGRMQIMVRADPPFHGWIFIKGHFDENSCRWNFYNNTERQMFVLLKYDQCGVQRSRSVCLYFCTSSLKLITFTVCPSV